MPDGDLKSLESSTFAELGLSAKVMEAVNASGYTTPTPIQAGAIPVAVDGKDVLGIAQTGTGKTAAFVLPLLSRLERGRARARMPRSLILAPTRELAAQVSEAFETYGTNHKFTMALLIGGVSFGEQLKKLDRGVDVLIATPGRLLDHFSRGKLLLTGVEILVIDEADRMLDMGFIPDIEKICKLLPPRRQTLFFSATMPNEITRLAKQFLKDPVRVEVAKPATTAKTIRQEFQFLPDGTDWVKRDVLRKLILEQTELQNAIIFCNRKRDVAILLKSLKKHGFNAGALHGDMDQSSRMATLAAFRSGEITILAASDVAARGLDIPEVSHVFNYDMPWQSDDYVHRIGRTGRAGRKGYAAALVTADDMKVVRELEKAAGVPIEWIGDPPGDDVESTRRGRGGRGGRGGSAGRGRGGSSGGSGGGSGKSDAAASSAGGRSRGGRGRSGKPKTQSETGAVQDAASSSNEADAAQSDAQPTADRPTQPANANDAPRGRRSRRRGPRRPDGEQGSGSTQANTAPDQAKDPAPDIRENRAENRSDQARQEQARPNKSREDKPRENNPREQASRSRSRSSNRPDSRADKRSDNQSDKRNEKRNDKPAGKVAGDARGLGDNVPAFLQRPVRSNSSS